MQIRIRNWDKYNPKRDQSSFTWLRLNNDIFSCQDFIEYDAGELAIYIAILCEASKKNSGTIEIKEKYITQCARCDSSLFKSTLNKLTSDKYLEIIEDQCADAEVRESTAKDQCADAEVRHTTPTNERTNVTNETDGRSRESESILKRLSIETVRNLFDEKLAGSGRIKKVSGHTLPTTIVQDFMNLTGDPEWQDIAKWDEYFNRVKQSDWLTKKFNTTFSWLLKPDNAFKTMQGQYDNGPESAPKIDYGLKADALFEKIVRAGRYNFKEVKAELTEIDMKAIENIGGTSVIFDSTNFTMDKIKNQLKAAYRQILEEQL